MMMNIRGRWAVFGLGFAVICAAARPAVSPALSRHVEVSVNGVRCGASDAGWPIFPGRPNRLTIAARELGGPVPTSVRLDRLYPDGRRSDATARFTPTAKEVTLELGLFAVPAAFDFEAGVVHRRGTRFKLQLEFGADGPPAEVIELHQTIAASGEEEILALGRPERVVHQGGLQRPARPMDPPFELSLAPAVLSRNDDVTIHVRSSRETKGRLLVTAALDGKRVLDRMFTAAAATEHPLDVSGLPHGRYRIEFVPEVEGAADSYGPVIVYTRAENPSEVRLSPLAPLAFERDSARAERVVRNFGRAVQEWSATPLDEATWKLARAGKDDLRLIAATGDWRGTPVLLRPDLRGTYAVFAETEGNHSYVRIGTAGLVRGIHSEYSFVDAADLTDEEIAVFPAAVPGSGLRELRFVPITPESLARVRHATSRPPKPLRAAADWGTYFHPPPSHHSGGGRVGPDQLDALLGGQAELGLTSIGWTVGRSWVEYHSRLPQATRFPAVPLESIAEEYQHTYRGRAFMVNDRDPYDYVLAARERHGVAILPMLAMQRHYGDVYGGIFRSEWFRTHPEWRRWSKGAARASNNAVSYYFPEVRKERLDILCEVAERGPDGVVVDWCRQVPVLLYHPKMVAEYRERTGIDPSKIDATREREYRDWIQWRANFATETLRELRARLDPIRKRTGRAIPVSVRVPSTGFFYNLAQGLDVDTWCREQLVHELQLVPLEDTNWQAEPHDVRPYIDLARRHGLRVYGGVNGNTFWNYPAVLRRAAGLLRAGVDGIELYESTNFASLRPERWLIPLLGDARRTEAFLQESNLEACHPIFARNACSGYDNHSFRSQWSVYGFGSNSL